ncbi:MAG: M48 family metallopeptidase [Lachnospiraceae bacterium]|nr:M48 family metallopeptidase [Lachnospiraceae bacterium]
MEEIKLQAPDGRRVSCAVIRSKRRSYGIVINEEGQVSVRIPLRGSVRTAETMVREKQDWIFEKIELQKQRKRIRSQQAALSESKYTPEQRAGLEKRYRQAAKEYIPKRADYYAQLLGVTYERIRIADQKTRWGSCSSKGTLSFNWKLMLAPPKVLDYVVVHELCHLIEMNHSPRFWKQVENVIPDYKEYRKWLKENGITLQL